MNKIVTELNDNLLQLQALLDVTAIALDEGTPAHNKKIFWSGLFQVAGKLTQQALDNVENLQDAVLDRHIQGGNLEKNQ